MRELHTYNGFLLIEVLTALAILGVFVVVAMLSLARGVVWNHDARLRLRALNAAATIVEYLSHGRPVSQAGKKIQGCIVTVGQGNVVLDRGKHDKIIPSAHELTESFKTVVVTSEWESAAGEKKSVQLLTGITIGKGQVL